MIFFGSLSTHLAFVYTLFFHTSPRVCVVVQSFQSTSLGKKYLEQFNRSLFFKQTYNIMINVVALDHLEFEQNLENVSAALHDRI